MKLNMKKTILSFLLLISTITFAQKPNSYVVDNENLFSVEQRQNLEKILNDYQKKTSIEMVVLTSPDFGKYDDISSFSVETFKHWGIGKKGLNNGVLLLISKEHRKWWCTLGYGLEELIPDATCKQIGEETLPLNFKKDDYFTGAKSFIVTIQNKIGNTGFEQMITYKRKIEKEQFEKNKAAFFTFLKIIILIAFLIGLFFLIKFIISQNKKHKEQIAIIQNLLKRIDLLKDDILKNATLPTDKQNAYDKYYTKKVTKKDFTDETKNNLNNLYLSLLEFKQLINSVNSTTQKITDDIENAKKYLNEKYDYCEEYFKNELTSFIPDISKLSRDFTSKNLNTLIGVQSVFENKFNTFLDKTAKMSAFIKDYSKLNEKFVDVDKQYESYSTKKEKLSTLKIGNKTVPTLDYNKLKNKIFQDMKQGMEYLKNNDYNNAINLYATYITTLAVINGAFVGLDRMLDDYKNGEIYVKNNQNELNDKILNIEKQLHEDGVSSSRKNQLDDIKTLIPTFQQTILLDVIGGTLLLKNIINSLNSLNTNIQNDKQELANRIAEEIAEKQRQKDAQEDARLAEISRQESYSSSSSSSSSDFGSFGGGNTGGGGAGGTW